MRLIDNMTESEREILALKGMTAPKPHVESPKLEYDLLLRERDRLQWLLGEAEAQRDELLADRDHWKAEAVRLAHIINDSPELQAVIAKAEGRAQ